MCAVLDPRQGTVPPTVTMAVPISTQSSPRSIPEAHLPDGQRCCRVDNDVTDCCVKTGVWVITCKWCTEVSFKKQTCKFFCIILSIIQGHELKSFPLDEVCRLQDSPNAPSLSTYRLLVLLPRCSWWPYPDASTMMSVWWCPCHDPHRWCSYHAAVPLMLPHHDSPIILQPHQKVKILLCQSFKVN